MYAETGESGIQIAYKRGGGPGPGVGRPDVTRNTEMAAEFGGAQLHQRARY